MAVKYEHQEKVLSLVIAKDDRTSLFGRSWMRFVKLNWESMFSVKVSSIDEILKKYSSVFTTGKIGLIKEFQARIELKEGAIPKFHRARPVSYAPKEGVEKELDRLETVGVMRKVERSDKVLACVLECTLSRWPEDMKDDRTTPHTVAGLSPAQFLKQSVRTRLTVIKPSLQDHLQDKQLKDKEYHYQRVPKLREFVKNECVCVKNC